MFSRKKQKAKVATEGKIDISIGISLEYGHPEYTDEEENYIEQGYIEGIRKDFYPPGSVFVASPKSKVYHVNPYCCGICISNDYIAYDSEDECIQMGLSRCKKCKWEQFGGDADIIKI